jgi:hypothetical protein
VSSAYRHGAPNIRYDSGSCGAFTAIFVCAVGIICDKSLWTEVSALGYNH